MLPIRNLFAVTCVIFYLSTLNAASYDRDILNTYSKLSARFILMSSQKTKIEETIEICLLHEAEDKLAVEKFIDLTKGNYPQGIKEYKILFKKSNYEEFKLCGASQLYFLFNTNEESLKKVFDFSLEKKILTISYSDKFLEEGVDISLFIGRKIVPYINLQSISKKDIELDNILLRISKIYTQDKTGSK